MDGLSIALAKCKGIYVSSFLITKINEVAFNAKARETPNRPNSLINNGTKTQFKTIQRIINLTEVLTFPVALNILIAGVMKLTSKDEIKKKLNDGNATSHF